MKTADRLVCARWQINAHRIFLKAYFKVEQTNALVSVCYLIHDKQGSVKNAGFSE
jgi:hypothetical protein